METQQEQTDIIEPDIMNFYLDKGSHPDGFTFEECLAWDDEAWEKSHNHIQWMFPTNEASENQPFSPVLTDSDIAFIRKDDIFCDIFRINILKAFSRWLKFMGLTIKVINLENSIYEIVERENAKDRFPIWFNYKNHNLLRITRVLKSLRIFGCESTARKFFNKLMEYADKGVINKESVQYWIDAMK